MKTMKNIMTRLCNFKGRMAAAALAAVFLCLSCDNYVTVEQPNSQLTGETVFTDMTTATAALSGLYAKMRANGIMAGNSLGVGVHLGLYADELDSYTAAPNNFYNNTLQAGDSPVGTLWNHSYRQIYEANAIIEGVANSQVLPQAGRDQVHGEALFVRGLLHFYLVNLFGDIPYVKTTDYEQNSRVSRLPVGAVYAQIKADLELAASLLPEAYVSPERVRPNRFATRALLARVCLYRGDYAEAANHASAVIGSPMYGWEADHNKVFLKAAPTTLLQFIPAAVGNSTLEGSLFIFTAGPPPTVALKPAFVNAFEANDQRKVKWVKAVTTGSNTWYHAFKYKQQNNGTASNEYSVLLRLAEQFLIRAEARAMQGELTNARQDVNFIRSNAGLPPSTAATATDIMAEVLKQRRFELFTEFGHRFLDLKRYNLLDATLGASKPGWNTTDRLWPLPANELALNPNLNPQNAGY